MRREYRGESADEWLHITCPEDVPPLESAADLGADYDAELDEPNDPIVSTPEQIAARRAFVERHFANFPDLQQRLAMLDAEAK